MPYTPLNWQDGEQGGTPISATNLNRMEQGIADAHDLLDAATDEANADTIMMRDSAGRAKVEDPVEDDHIATKGYVDTAEQTAKDYADNTFVRIVASGQFTISEQTGLTVNLPSSVQGSFPVFGYMVRRDGGTRPDLSTLWKTFDSDLQVFIESPAYDAIEFFNNDESYEDPDVGDQYNASDLQIHYWVLG